jgi:hypothetical protein
LQPHGINDLTREEGEKNPSIDRRKCTPGSKLEPTEITRPGSFPRKGVKTFA